jgi:DNA processing protein
MTLRVPSSLPRGERAARVTWARLVEPGNAEVARLIAAVGAEGALHSLDRDTRLGERVSGRLPDLAVSRDLEIVRSLGARIAIPGDDEWPAGLDSLDVAPWCLWVRGPLHLAESCHRSVSIVGARAATSYGISQAQELGSGLVERGFTVISGAAYGIDGAAHEGALALEGPTIALTAGGIDRPYPRGHEGLFTQIANTGAVASEIPPGWAPTRNRFLARNRMIATLSRGTVVVEAGIRSGSLNTARTAARHHRVVCALPGSVESAVSAGCHAIIRDGMATLVTDAAEAAEAIGGIGELAPVKGVAGELVDNLDEVQAAVFSALPIRRPVEVADVARRCGLSVPEVTSALGVLGASGLAERLNGGWRKCPQDQRGPAR